MRYKLLAAACTALSIVAGAPVSAQSGPGIPTFDFSSVAQAIESVKKAQTLIDQGTSLYNNVHGATNVNSIGSVLNSSAVRNVLPTEAQDISKLMSGDITNTGSVGTRAEAILKTINLDTGTGTSTADKAYQSALQQAGQKTATNAAVAETAFNVTTQRTQGLEQLRTSLDTATDQKQVQDLQARIAVEQAHIQNDQMQLQAVAMRQAAQDQLDLESDDARRTRNLNASLGK